MIFVVVTIPGPTVLGAENGVASLKGSAAIFGTEAEARAAAEVATKKTEGGLVFYATAADKYVLTVGIEKV